ncbi:MAG: hypothetical protein MUF59_09985 [Candidatus Krumholzibacteria bacterium]|nr:hypothetical protein [Candidatus Krumholzibacteria bacterium]
MKRSVFVSTLLAAVVLTGIADAVSADSFMGDPVRLMRRPDINQGRIVFSYQSDLWVVSEEGGLARRLTVHEGTEDYPKFSPDGTRIAFCGDYNERLNSLFVIPSNGGVPLELTFHSASAEPVTWTRDGRYVVFSSARESFVRFFDQFFKVPADGGLPVDIGIGKASFGSFSPDGTKIAYNRHPGTFWWWKRYKGSQNNDVWIYDFTKDTFTRITSWEGNDSWPMWTGNSVYYVSDREGDIANLWVHDLGAGTDRQLTRFEKHGVTWPSISSDGKKIVFEREARLYVFDTETEKYREVVVYSERQTHHLRRARRAVLRAREARRRQEPHQFLRQPRYVAELVARRQMDRVRFRQERRGGNLPGRPDGKEPGEKTDLFGTFQDGTRVVARQQIDALFERGQRALPSGRLLRRRAAHR